MAKVSPVATRGAPPPAQPAGTTDRRRRRTTAVLLATGLLAVGLIIGLALQVLAQDSTPGTDDVIDLGDGRLSVTDVRPELMTHPEGMPAGMMPDPVPDGFRRFSVDVVLTASATALPYSWDSLRVSAPGMEAADPLRGSLDSGVLPAGAKISGSILFQVPDDVEDVSLSVDGYADAIPLELSPADDHGSGHSDDAQHDDGDDHEH